MNRSRHTSLSQTMAAARRRSNTRSTGGSGTPYTPSGMPPVADAGADQTVELDLNTNSVSVSFDGSNSYDPDDGTNPGDGIVSYAWNFGDGDEDTEASTGSGATPSHTYTSTGTYTVTLTVTDNENKTDRGTMTVTVKAPPEADAGADQTVDINTVITFDGSASRAHAGRTIASYYWDFGLDATPAIGTGDRPSCTYSTPGEKTVTLTVTDSEDDSNSDMMTVTVKAPPLADAGNDQMVDLDLNTNSVSVSFDGSNSYDFDGGALTYAWDFGDGSTGSGATPSHTYTSTGAYTVELTVTDDENKTDSDSIIVIVSDPPSLTLIGPDTVTRGDTTTYTAKIIPAGLTLDATPTFNWKYTADIRGNTVRITESINATAQNPQTTTWSGTMVKSGTLEVRTTVNGTEYVQTVNVTVNDRTWVTEVPITTDTTSWGTEAPRQHSDLGDVEYDMPFTAADDLDAAAVSSGPNKGILYIVSLNLTAPYIVKINRHFGMAADDFPPCWVAFKEANTRYGEIEAKVKARLGFDGTTSGTLYGSWEDEIHFSDPKANLEDYLEIPGGLLSDYENQIALYLSGIGRNRIAGMDRHESGWSPSGITITYNYLAADAGEDQTADINTDVTFDGSASCVPAGRTIESYSWNFGSDATPATGTGVNPSCAYSTHGAKTVTLNVTDSGGDTVSDTMIVTVKAPPVADAGDDQTVEFDSNTNSVNVSFDGSNSYDPDDGTNPGDGIDSYAWRFGDGSIGSGKTPSHTYTTPGTYTVELTVTDDENKTNSDTMTVAATAPPVADPGDDKEVYFNSNTNSVSVNFDGSNSYDPDDGTNPGDGIVSYAWSFGDGSTGSGKTPSHTYTSTGTYTVELTVTDNEQVEASDSLAVTVQPDPGVLTAEAGPNQTVSVDSTVTFDGSGSYAPPGRTIAAYAWNFGDGNTGSGVKATHAYGKPGVYSVTLTITDDQDNEAMDTITVTVFNGTLRVDNPQLFIPEASPSDGDSVGGASGASGVSGTSGRSRLRSELGTTTKTTTPPGATTQPDTTPTTTIATPTVAITYAVKPAMQFFAPSRVRFTIEGTVDGSTYTKQYNLPGLDQNTNVFEVQWDGTDNLGNRVPDGNYTVRASVYYRDSEQPQYTYESSTHAITVKTDTYPIAEGRIVTPVALRFVGQEIEFDASASYDPDDGLGMGITSYEWDFGEGATPQTVSGPTASTASCTYSSPGNKSVTLTVWDNDVVAGANRGKRRQKQFDPVDVAESITVEILPHNPANQNETTGSSAVVDTMYDPANDDSNTTKDDDKTKKAKIWYRISGGQLDQFPIHEVTLVINDSALNPEDDTDRKTGGHTSIVITGGQGVHSYEWNGKHNGSSAYGTLYAHVRLKIDIHGTGTPGSFGDMVNDSSNADGTWEQYYLSNHQAVAVSSFPRPIVESDRFVSIDHKIGYAEVEFNGMKSHDPDDGTNPGDGIKEDSYLWDFDDGSSASGSVVTHRYGAHGKYPVCLTVTDNESLSYTHQFTLTVVSVEPRHVNDGANALFFVLGGGDAEAWSWDWHLEEKKTNKPGEDPVSVNDPTVDFATPNASTTFVPKARWYAYPKYECKTEDLEPAATTCEYMITCDITFPNGSVQATSILTVSVPWEHGGGVHVEIVNRKAYEKTERDFLGFVRYKDIGQIQREVVRIEDAVWVPRTTQFYNKIVVHEQKHIDQYAKEDGIARDYYSLDRLNDFLKDTLGNTAQSESDLDAEVNIAINRFIISERRRLRLELGRGTKHNQLEIEAYEESDDVPPQFLYQNCGRFYPQ